MLAHLAQYWWLVALRGILAILFGLFTVIWSGITLAVLALLLGGYVLVDGFLAATAAIAHHSGSRRWWLLLLEGAVGVLVGIVILGWPGVTAYRRLDLITLWAILKGIFEIVQAVELRRDITNEWRLVVGGLLSVLFGVLLGFSPLAGDLGVIGLIAAYALVSGVLMLRLSLRLKGRAEREPQTAY